MILAIPVLLLLSCDNDKMQVNTDRVLSDDQLRDVRISTGRKSPGGFIFGFDLRATPEEDARQYLPFLKYLEKKTGYKFRLRFTPVDGKIVDDLGQGKVHFAAIGAISFIRAHEKYQVVPLARGLNSVGEAEYRSMIVVPSNSTIKNIKDLAGKRVAFGSITSTQGHIIPRIMFARHGISLGDLGGYIYTGSHQRCADAVVAGRADACGMQDKLAESLAAKGLVKILLVSEYFPSSGIAANKGLPGDVLANVTRAILDFRPNGRDAENLYHWQRTEMPNGFQKASLGDYSILRRWLKKLESDTTGNFRNVD
jgi:phosphonate transport system substrate-binding protein